MEGYGHQHNADSCYWLLKAGAIIGDLDYVRSVVNKMEKRKIQHTVYTYNIVLLAYAKAQGPFSEFQKGLREMGTPVDPQLLVDESDALFDYMVQEEGLIPNNQTMANRLLVRTAVPMMQESIRFWREEFTKWSLEPDQAAYHHYATMFCRSSLPHAAEILFAEMMERNVDPSVNTVYSICKGLIKTGKIADFEKAMSWLKVAEKANQHLLPEQVSAINALIAQTRYDREQRKRVLLSAIGEEAATELTETRAPQKRLKVREEEGTMDDVYETPLPVLSKAAKFEPPPQGKTEFEKRRYKFLSKWLKQQHKGRAA
eukprot:TRINITY_DN57762_c0_g3_i1.p2 TRINITY_DN57762_c0_g3~~TRINITY_DN57762_c0_g3_i1.p2  ORF type:complete len:358 (-),score=44.07 TRINITY_DN57762_c0_g3_i1:1465-2409(-)